MAKNVTVVGIKVINDDMSTASTIDITKVLECVVNDVQSVDLRKMAVANLSLCSSISPAMDAAVAAAV